MVTCVGDNMENFGKFLLVFVHFSYLCIDSYQESEHILQHCVVGYSRDGFRR